MAYSIDTISRVLEGAVALSDPRERQHYLQSECGTDADLRREVDELLEHHAEAGTFLEPVAGALGLAGVTTALAIEPEPAVVTIRGYGPLVEIGKGAFGTVYRAEQMTPIRRVVAIKVLNSGMDSTEVIARFANERQALAIMDHPQIAKIYDAGTTETGRPYFVMEYVDGSPITNHCSVSGLSLRDRIRLMIEACRAVQHAHQKGVIHRDLKPSNILVSRQDASHLVKIIDFGIAKAVDQHVFGQAFVTQQRQLLGTPLYMSPEQAELGAVDIDTRSDVYSLGSVLYELLTGTTPFDKDSLSKATLDELRTTIQDTEPLRPSQRLRVLSGPDGSERSSGYDAGGRVHPRELEGELDWIVMRALEKDRARRYESPSALAADLERFLAGEAVLASPPSSLYRLQKLASRHRGVLTTTIAMMLIIVGAAAVAFWQAFEANAARALGDLRLSESREGRYASEMLLASQTLQRNDVRRMNQLLDRQIPGKGETDLRQFEWYFLSRHVGLQGRTLLQSEGPLYAVKWSPRGAIAAAGARGVITIFNGKEKGIIEAGQTEINGLDFSPRGHYLASCGDDGTVCVWRVETREEVHRFKAHDNAVYHVLYAKEGNLLLTCGRDRQIRMWDLGLLPSYKVLKGHTDHVESMALTGNGQLVSGSRDNSVKTWNVSEGSLVRDKTDHPASTVNAVAVSPDSQIVAAGHDNGLLSLTVDGETRIATQTFLDGIHSLAFSPRPQNSQPHVRQQTDWLAVGDRGGSVYLLPLDKGFANSGIMPSDTVLQRSRQWQAHQGRVYSLCYSANGRTLYTAGEDGLLKAWEIDHAPVSRKLPRELKDFVSVSGSTIACAGGGLRLYSTNEDLNWGERHIWGGASQAASVRYAAEASRLFFQRAEMPQINSIAPDGTDAKTIIKLEPNRLISGFAVASDGRRLAVVTSDLEREQLMLEFPMEAGRRPVPLDSGVTSIEYSQDGLVILDQSKEIWVIDPQNQIQAFPGSAKGINQFVLSPDEKYLAVASSDRLVRVWDWRERRELWWEVAHPRGTDCVAFSPDGETVATCGDDRMLYLWRWRQKMPVLEYPLAEWPVDKLAFSEDGYQLYVLARNQLRIYDGRPQSSPPQEQFEGVSEASEME